MARILWLSDSPFTCTGYSTISTNICNGFAEAGHEVFYIAHNYVGQDLPPGVKFKDGKELKFTVIGTSREPYAQDLIVPKIRELKPDIYGVLLDTFMLYPRCLQQDYAPAKTIFYFPSDGGGGMPLRCEEILKKCNYPVAMAKFGQRQVEEIHDLKTRYIPHAIDDKVYYPLSKEERFELRKKWGFQDKFVIGSVYRNQGRKMADRMFKAFAIFAKNHPDAILFCHSDPYDGAAVFDSINLINRLGIQNRVIFSGMSFLKGFDYKKMNEVYNLMDVFFLSTSGEGFGVPIIEAMACGIPSVVTDYTTTHELLVEDGECGVPAKLETELTGSWNVERGIMDLNSAVEAFEKLYNFKDLREKLGKEGVEKVKKYYTWDVVNKQWNNLIKEIVEK